MSSVHMQMPLSMEESSWMHLRKEHDNNEQWIFIKKLEKYVDNFMNFYFWNNLGTGHIYGERMTAYTSETTYLE